MSSNKTYVKNAIGVVEALITEDNPETKLSRQHGIHFHVVRNRSWMKRPKLNNELGSRFLQLIGILRWTIELGRLNKFVKCHNCLNTKQCHGAAILRHYTISLLI